MKGGMPMPMNPNFLCCIGAELKNSTQQTTRMTQVYLYRAFEDDTIADMLSPGFFDAALGIIRKDDLLLLYSPNEATAKWTYARVSNVDRDGVTVAQIGIDATAVSVDTTDYSNISGDNLQEIINSIDTAFSDYVKKDGTSIMTGPLKMRAGSMQGAIAAYWDGVGFFKLNDNDSVTLLASMEATDGLCPATNNTYNIGKTNYKWKDAYIARVITAVLNNGYDIAVPITSGPDTFALKSQVDAAANSGSQLYTTGVWYAKMYAGTTPPSSAEVEGRNYADFSQVDGNGDPIIVIYTYTSGAWAQTATITPPANYNGYITITSKIWDISEQSGQQGGLVLWAYNTKTFTPYPKIISFESPAFTGTPTTPDLTPSSPDEQVANKKYIDALNYLTPEIAVKKGLVSYVLLTKDFIQSDFNPSTRPSGSKTALRFMAGTVLKTPSGDIFSVGDTDSVIEVSTIVQGTALAAGDKAYIYLVSNGDGTASPVVSKSASYSGYMIGGFAMLCPLRGGSFTNLPAAHPYYSYSNSGNQIMHTSVWHLKNAYPQTLGVCVYNSEKRLWVQAYIPSLYNSSGTWQSGSYSTTNGGGTRYTDPTLMLQSVYNASPSNNMTFGEQSQWLKMAGGRYIFDDEFTSSAEGSNEQTNVNGSNQKANVGGWYDTANRPMISNFGVWEMNGFYWQDIAICAAGGSQWDNQGLNKGQTYGGQRLRAGARWGNGADSGSLSRDANNAGVHRIAANAARGVSPCYEII